MTNSGEDGTRRKVSAKKWIKRALWTLFLGGLAAGVVMAAIPEPLAVELATIERGAFRVTVNEDGVSRIRDRYVVSAPLAGTLARLELHPGDEVQQGQILARILPLSAPLLDARSRTEAEAQVSAASAGLRQANAQIERARAAVDFSKKEAQSTSDLAKTGTISQLELDRARLEERSSLAELTSAEFAAKVATHQLAMARSALGRFSKDSLTKDDQFEVTSPTSGRVLKVLQQSEGVIQAGASLVELGDPKALEIVVDVLTSDATEIKPGAQVLLTNWGGPDLVAVVRLVEPAGFSRLSALGVEEQRVNVVIDLAAPEVAYEALGDGYRVEARILVYSNDAAVKIPWSALFRDEGGWAAYIESAGRAKKVPVQVGRRNDTHAEILEGLAPGATVLRHPSDRVAEGVAIQGTN